MAKELKEEQIGDMRLEYFSEEDTKLKSIHELNTTLSALAIIYKTKSENINPAADPADIVSCIGIETFEKHIIKITEILIIKHSSASGIEVTIE